MPIVTPVARGDAQHWDHSSGCSTMARCKSDTDDQGAVVVITATACGYLSHPAGER